MHRLGYGRKALECLLCHREKRGRRRLRVRGERDEKKERGRVRADDRRERRINLRLNRRLKWWVSHSQMKSQMDFCLRGGTTIGC